MNIEYCQIPTSKGVIRGTIHRMHNTTHLSHMILIIHGYLSSNRIGPHRLYFQMAQHLCSTLESCVARFDCPGMGESDCDIETLSFNDFVKTYKELINILSLQYGIKKFILIGHCLGGNLATYLATKINNICGVILIAPSTTDESSIKKFFPNDGQAQELLRTGHTKRRGLFVHASFFSGENSRKSLIKAISKLSCEVALIESGRDEFYSQTPYEDVPHNCKYYCIKDADHNYLDLSSRDDLFNIITSELDLYASN